MRHEKEARRKQRQQSSTHQHAITETLAPASDRQVQDFEENNSEEVAEARISELLRGDLEL